ncbi:MAG: hypothetical protein M3N91_07580, partial [Pseudomonadota bacterium]|nr:hypothetical protein [Pseudomonadota bacterium]
MIGKLIKSLFPSRPYTGGGAIPGPRVSPREVSRQYRVTNPWHAVAIVPCTRACTSARGAASKRYLSQEAPGLPLSGCTERACTCHYRHYEDRRSSLRRTSDVMASSLNWPGRERRG